MNKHKLSLYSSTSKRLIQAASFTRVDSMCVNPSCVLSCGAGLRGTRGVRAGGLSHGGGLGSAHSDLLPVSKPQLPEGHPGRLLPGRRYRLR